MSGAADATRLIEALVSKRCGLVNSLTPQGRGPDEPTPPYLWNATLAQFGFVNTTKEMRLTGGKGRTEAEAKLSALGEAMERYAAFHWDSRRIRVGPASEDAITPADCVLYSDIQYAAGRPFQPWSPDLATSWIEGADLATGAPVDLPASLVYLLAPPPRRDDYFAPASSNGLATGPDLTRAVLGGLYEVIERDAFMITWLNRLPATMIETPKRGCDAARVIRHYSRFGVTLRLLSLPTDQTAHVIMAVAQDPDQNSAFRVIGLGCDIDPVVAVDKAVAELCQLRPGMKGRMQGSDFRTRLRRYSDVKSFDDHPLFHAIHTHAGEFDFLTQKGRSSTLDDLPRPDIMQPKDALQANVASVVATGARVAYADITTSDIAPLGLRVARTIVTGFQPIHFGVDEGRLGGARLYQAPVDLGLHKTPLDEATLNPCPHPLA